MFPCCFKSAVTDINWHRHSDSVDKMPVQILKKFKELGVEVFLDLKLHDIPNQVKKTVAAIATLKNVKYLRHASHTCRFSRTGERNPS